MWKGINKRGSLLMGDKKVVSIHSRESKEDKKFKSPTNKEIVDEMMGEFSDWIRKSYGFEIGDNDLKQLAVQLFWSEFVYHKREQLADQQAKEIEKKIEEESQKDEA